MLDSNMPNIIIYYSLKHSDIRYKSREVRILLTKFINSIN